MAAEEHLRGFAGAFVLAARRGESSICMVRQVDAILSQEAFRPLEPIAIPEGTRVHHAVEEDVRGASLPAVAKVLTRKLESPDDAAGFQMERRETRDAGL